MRKILVACAVAFSTQLFASATFVYKGKGAWKDNSGSAGHYEIQVSKKIMGNGLVKITTNLDLGDKDMSWTAFIRHQEYETFEVLNSKREPIGTGYCFEKGNDTHLCHMEAQPTPDMKVEKTLHIELDTIHSMGSKTFADGKKIMWTDSVERISP